MSRENVERVRVGYEAFNRGDWQALETMLDPEIEMDLSEVFLDRPRLRGTDELRAFFASEIPETWGGFQAEPVEFIDASDRQVLVIVEVTGTGMQSGLEIAGRFGHLWTFRNDLLVNMRAYRDVRDALEAAGLSE
jgi:ketosteroid isomerase-like protein